MLFKGTRYLGLAELVYRSVEYNDPHKLAPKLRGFPFTLRTNTVCHYMGVNKNGRPC